MTQRPVPIPHVGKLKITQLLIRNLGVKGKIEERVFPYKLKLTEFFRAKILKRGENVIFQVKIYIISTVK